MNKDRALRAGFVGFGRMGITHFSIMNGLQGVEIVAICEPSRTMRSALKGYLSPRLFSDYKEMIELMDLDLIVISTPPDSHAEIINLAIDNGIHFFVEKPLTLAEVDGQQIVNRLKESTIVNQVGYVNRFCETFSRLKQLLDEKIIGDIKTFSSEMYSATVLKDSSGGWRGQKKKGGGCSYEMASHCIDLVVFLFGRPKGVSGSVLQSVFSSNVDDLVTSTLIYSDSLSGRLVVNWSDASYRKPGNTVTVVGTDGKIIASKYHLRIFLKEAKPDLDLAAGWNTLYLTDLAANVDFYVRGNEFSLQLQDFLDCVRENKQTKSTCADAFICDQVLNSIAQDAERSSMILLGEGGEIPEEKAAGILSRLLRFLKSIFN